jgi:Ca2+-binding EF-hand superfamily protein
VAVYISVFFVQIIPAYVVKVYGTGAVIFIIFVSLAPTGLMYFYLLPQAIVKSVIVTSVEAMRNRRMVESVLRSQKEGKAVAMLRLFMAMEQEADSVNELTEEEDKEIEQAFINQEFSVQLEDIGHIFDEMDKDNSGTLSSEEIQQVYVKYGLNISEERHHEMMKNMDADAEGEAQGVDKKEFMKWMLSKEKQAQAMKSEEFSAAIMKWFDKDGSKGPDGQTEKGDNLVSVSEFQESLVKLGPVFTLDEVTQIVLELDQNDDGVLGKDNLMDWIERNSPGHHTEEECCRLPCS